MTAKLTLSINKDVIKNAKDLSQKKGVSISQMVEKFLKQSFEEQTEKPVSIKEDMPPLLKKLHGAVKTNDKRPYRDVYREYVIEKYSM